MRARARSLAACAIAAVVAAVVVARPAVRAQPASGLDARLAAFARIPGLSAEFREEKTIALLREPVVSTGTLYFAPPSRLARHVLAPTPSSLVLDGDTLRFGDARGETSLDLGATPAARALVDAFRSVLAGDRATLLRDFDARYEPEGGDAWRTELVPRSASARRLVTRVILAAEGVIVRTLEVREASGDVSRTTFTQVDVRRRFTRAELRRLFRVGGG